MSTVVNVVSKIELAEGIFAFEFGLYGESELPSYQAGAHIDVPLKSGGARQYSLYEQFSSNANYKIAIQREPEGRGGSIELCETLAVGDEIRISQPRNNFELEPGWGHYVLMGGGIGITPIVAMADALHESGSSFELHYCVRNEERAAFSSILENKPYKQNISIHLDNGSVDQLLDLKELFDQAKEKSQIYMCGPEGFMRAVEKATKHWPDKNVKKEFFSAPTAIDTEPNGAFTVRLAKSGNIVEVGENESIVEALKKVGYIASISCCQGLCGSCITTVIDGKPIHKDHFLTEKEKLSGTKIAVCVSRAVSNTEITLDI